MKTWERYVTLEKYWVTHFDIQLNLQLTHTWKQGGGIGRKVLHNDKKWKKKVRRQRAVLMDYLFSNSWYIKVTNTFFFSGPLIETRLKVTIIGISQVCITGMWSLWGSDGRMIKKAMARQDTHERVRITQDVLWDWNWEGIRESDESEISSLDKIDIWV